MAKRSREDNYDQINAVHKPRQLQQKQQGDQEPPSPSSSSKRCKGMERADEEEEDGGGKRPGWQRQLWLCGMGYEELLWGWFPFVEEDFRELDDLEKAGLSGCEDLEFDDDIWHIKNINEIPADCRRS